MKTLQTLTFFVFFVLLSHVKAYAHNHASDNKDIKMADHAEFSGSWARATFALAKTGAAYTTLTNTGANELLLMKASVDASIAGMTELHHTEMEDGMMRMQELEEGVTVPASGIVNFVPGGKHIMLMGLTGPLEAGVRLDITFTFADESTKTVNFEIKDAR